MALTAPANFAADFAPVLAQKAGEHREVLRVATYEQCYITHSGLGIKRLRLLPETTFANVPKPVRRHFLRYAVYKYLTEPRVRLDDPSLLLVHNHWSSGYHHWMTEALVKLRFVDPSAHVVILPSSYPAFARESLRLFPCGGIVPLPNGHGAAASRVTVVENPLSGRYSQTHIDWLRSVTAGAVDRASPPARLYITRQREQLRRVENEAEVIRALEPYDFRVIDPRDMSFFEQVVLFSRAEAVVSVHGAGLTNCIFMPEGARVLELYRALTVSAPGMNTCYWNLANAAGLVYYYQFCAHGRHEGDRSDADRVNIVVDVEKLRRNVELMLTGP